MLPACPWGRLQQEPLQPSGGKPLPLCPSPQAPLQVPTTLASLKQVWVEASSELVLPAGGHGQHQQRCCPQFPRLLWPLVSERSGLSGILLTSAMLSESLDRQPQPWHGDGVQQGRGGLRAQRPGPSPACPHRLPVVEWTMTSMRAVTMAILGSTYSIGQMAVGGLAFALRDWRTLQLAGSVPFFVIFLISWSVRCGAFSLGEKRQRDPRRCSSPLPLWLATAPKMLRPWKRVM